MDQPCSGIKDFIQQLIRFDKMFQASLTFIDNQQSFGLPFTFQMLAGDQLLIECT